MCIQAVIFDLDGTILDTTEGVIESIKYAAEFLGCKAIYDEEWSNFIGPPIKDTLMEKFGCSEEEAKIGTAVFREYYAKKALMKAVPYDGIYEVCNELKNRGIKTAIATYKREDYAIRLLTYFGFDKYFSPIHGADGRDSLSKRDIVNRCVDEIAVSTKKCVLVGDTSYDAKAAEESGINFIAVTYGFGYRSEEEVKSKVKIGVAKFPKEILSLLNVSKNSL